jgi:hypothetical protein
MMEPAGLDLPRAFLLGIMGEQICCDAICKCNWAALCAADGRAATEGWAKAYLLQISNVEGAKAHDDFTSSILGHDVILDAKRGLAGVFDLARWNWSRGELWLIPACRLIACARKSRCNARPEYQISPNDLWEPLRVAAMARLVLRSSHVDPKCAFWWSTVAH